MVTVKVKLALFFPLSSFLFFLFFFSFPFEAIAAKGRKGNSRIVNGSPLPPLLLFFLRKSFFFPPSSPPSHRPAEGEVINE